MDQIGGSSRNWTKHNVVVLDTEPSRIQYLKHILELVECEVFPAADAASLKSQLEEAKDTGVSIFLGPAISADNQTELLKAMTSLSSKLPVFLLKDNNGSEAPIDLTGSGIDLLGTLEIPAQLDALMGLLHKAQVYNESAKGGGKLNRPVELFRSLSGNGRATRQINKMIEQVADSEATVLILGESGTGKEVVARKLHYHSKRRGKPFVPVNCGAIPSDLLESELFGHEKGAFTGAITARQGRFEMAEGGTLFLDEIGDMSMHMQVKILRVLQERTFERVGSNKTLQSDVRIIAATHRNLEREITEGKFREDLYYRLNVFPIEMPPLRDRTEDIPVLVNDLIARIENEKRGSVRLTPAGVSALCQYRWPGNVRELANLIERLAILYPYGVVDAGDLPEKFRPQGMIDVSTEIGGLPEVMTSGEEPDTVTQVPRLPRDGLDLKAHLNNLELSLIRQALDETEGVVAHAAKRLNMRRTTLVEKLRKYGLQRGQESTGI